MSTYKFVMPKQASVEELKKLPSVGETTAKVLQDKGYGTFIDIVRANPMDLHRECDIVLSSATHIISAAVEHIEGECPRCKSENINNEWQEYSESMPEKKDDTEVVCDDCGWYGNMDELN